MPLKKKIINGGNINTPSSINKISNDKVNAGIIDYQSLDLFNLLGINEQYWTEKKSEKK
tara:strand:+ start:82 stop:258 length:177 start_codon:yes stop_codon:yes gene_type:complete